MLELVLELSLTDLKFSILYNINLTYEVIQLQFLTTSRYSSDIQDRVERNSVWLDWKTISIENQHEKKH